MEIFNMWQYHKKKKCRIICWDVTSMSLSDYRYGMDKFDGKQPIPFLQI